MNEQEKKRKRIYDLLNAETKSKIYEKIGVSIKPRPLTPLIMSYEVF